MARRQEGILRQIRDEAKHQLRGFPPELKHQLRGFGGEANYQLNRGWGLSAVALGEGGRGVRQADLWNVAPGPSAAVKQPLLRPPTLFIPSGRR